MMLLLMMQEYILLDVPLAGIRIPYPAHFDLGHLIQNISFTVIHDTLTFDLRR